MLSCASNKPGGSCEDIFRKLPVLQSALSLFEQHQLAEHIKDKVNEVLTKNVWRAETEAKTRLSQQRNQLLQDDLDRVRMLRDKDAQIERLRETLTELTAATEQQKTAISGLEKDQYAAKCRHAAEVQRLTRALQATERCNARESGRVTIFDTQVKALNAKIAKYLGVVDATSANNAVYLGSDNVKMSRLEENVARLLRRLEALQSLTDSTRERANDERLDLLDVMQLPHSTGNIRLACCRIMSKIYVVIQSLQKDVDQLTTELGLESTMSAHLSTVTCDKKAERIHVAIVAIKADVARIHRRISEGGIPKATLNRKHKISVATSGTGYKTSPLSPKTPVPTPSPRWPLQHAKAGQLPSVLDQKDTEKRRFFGDDWNRTLPPVAMTRDVGRQAGSQRRQGTFLAS